MAFSKLTVIIDNNALRASTILFAFSNITTIFVITFTGIPTPGGTAVGIGIAVNIAIIVLNIVI